MAVVIRELTVEDILAYRNLQQALDRETGAGRSSLLAGPVKAFFDGISPSFLGSG